MVKLIISNTHGVYDPDDAAKLLTRLLEHASYSGEWQAFVREHARTSGAMGRFRVVRCDGRCIRVRLKPGDNNTAWDWELFPPMQFDAGKVAADLRRFDGWNGLVPKAKEAPPTLPAEKRLGLAERLADLEARAAEHQRKTREAHDLRAQSVTLLQQADEADQRANVLFLELASDPEGQAAVAALEQLHKLFGN